MKRWVFCLVSLLGLVSCGGGGVANLANDVSSVTGVGTTSGVTVVSTNN